MLRVTKGKGETKKRSRFTGICADAEALGVSREHLFRVLTGERQSRSLLRRYLELKQVAGMKVELDARSGPQGQKSQAENTSLGEPVPDATAKAAKARFPRSVRAEANPGGDGSDDRAGVGTVRMGKEQPGQFSLRRAPA